MDTASRRTKRRSCYDGKRLRPKARIVAGGEKALEEFRFRPMYAQANMGHPSRTLDSG
jgi:hypothetical protein